VDSYGLLIEFDTIGEEIHNSKTVLELINKFPRIDYTVAAKGYERQK